MDKAHEQAKITRQKNKALRDAARAEREAQEKADKALVLESLQAVLKDPGATAAQRLYAVAVLDNIKHYHFVPYGTPYPSQEADIGTDSSAILERMKNAAKKGEEN